MLPYDLWVYDVSVSLLYCAIARFSCYYACSCRPNVFIQSVMPVASGRVKVKVVFILLSVNSLCPVHQTH